MYIYIYVYRCIPHCLASPVATILAASRALGNAANNGPWPGGAPDGHVKPAMPIAVGPKGGALEAYTHNPHKVKFTPSRVNRGYIN